MSRTRKFIRRDIEDFSVKGRNKCDLEESPTFESVHKKSVYRSYRVKGKLIDKYLESQLGRNWNDVYSELCKILPEIVKNHIKDNVTLDCYEKDGEYYDNTCMYGLNHLVYGFFVDKNGILNFQDGSTNTFVKNFHNKHIGYKIIDGNTYARFDGIWFYVLTQPAPSDPHYSHKVYKFINEYNSRLIIIEKRQLCHSELKALGLTNFNPAMIQRLKEYRESDWMDCGKRVNYFTWENGLIRKYGLDNLR